MAYTVGSVPYLNAKPLIRQFEDLGDASPVKVVYDVPSLLPARLARGEVQAILVSSIEALRQADSRVVDGICIGSKTEVMSVRLYSKVPPAGIRSIALDQSSATSNALAQIVLKVRYGVEPFASPEPPDIHTMLSQYDACVLIGDNGMRESGEGLFVLDLGLEWFQMTSLPFVWAVWMGGKGLTPELAGLLRDACRVGQTETDAIVEAAAPETLIPAATCFRYLRDVMNYTMDPTSLAGLREFGQLLVSHGIMSDTHWPKLV